MAVMGNSPNIYMGQGKTMTLYAGGHDFTAMNMEPEGKGGGLDPALITCWVAAMKIKLLEYMCRIHI